MTFPAVKSLSEIISVLGAWSIILFRSVNWLTLRIIIIKILKMISRILVQLSHSYTLNIISYYLRRKAEKLISVSNRVPMWLKIEQSVYLNHWHQNRFFIWYRTYKKLTKRLRGAWTSLPSAPVFFKTRFKFERENSRRT